MTAETAGQAAWIARRTVLHGPDDGGDLLLTWPYLKPEQRAAEETGAQAAIDWQRAEDATPTAEDFDHAADVISGRAAPDPAAAMASLTKVVTSHERVMYAAAIDIRHGQPGEARRLLGEQLDGWDGPEWDGTETGAQYLERTREGS